MNKPLGLVALILALSSVSLAQKPVSTTDRPPLLFLHGFTCDPTSWRYQVDCFQKDHPAFAPILPLHPGSELQAEPTVEGLAATMLDYIDEKIGAAPVLIGHSLGGMVALQMALDSPDKVRALILVDAYPTLRVAREASLGMFGPKTPEPLRQNIQRDMSGTRARMSPAEREPLWSSIDTWDLVPRLGEINIPVFGIYGGRDRFSGEDAQKFKTLIALGRIPGATIALLPGVGHFPQLERPEEFNELLEGFLRELFQDDGQEPNRDTDE